MTGMKFNDLLDANNLPSTWRFNTCDASILGQYRVTLVRDDAGRKWWHSLPEETQEIVALYATGRGNTFDDALEDAIDKTIGGI